MKLIQLLTDILEKFLCVMLCDTSALIVRFTFDQKYSPHIGYWRVSLQKL